MKRAVSLRFKMNMCFCACISLFTLAFGKPFGVSSALPGTSSFGSPLIVFPFSYTVFLTWFAVLSECLLVAFILSGLVDYVFFAQSTVSYLIEQDESKQIDSTDGFKTHMFDPW